MVVCWSPAASSIASFTARREAGEPSTGTNIFIDKSEGLWEARCGGAEIRPQAYSSCPRKTRISRLGN